MCTIRDYVLYKEYLKPVPNFLNKYLQLDILMRLKDISLLCGMEYASKYAYDFNFSVSRYDHSVNVALITWRLTNDKKATLASLFHDVSSPVFSHVIDYMNEDYINQESTEEKTGEILSNCKQLIEYLKEDDIKINEIIDFKNYSIADLPRPCMCADRLDNIITLGMCWVGLLEFSDSRNIIDSICVNINEQSEKEIGFSSDIVAKYVTYINDLINVYTHTNEDTFMMMLAAKMVKKSLELDILNYDELFLIGEHEALLRIQEASKENLELKELYTNYTSIKNIPKIEQPQIKNKTINPLVKSKRLKPNTQK